jgi:hypothetical protein
VKKAYNLPFFKEEPFAQMWKDFEMVGDAGSHYPINPAWGAMESFVPGVIVDIFSMSANGQVNDESLKELLLQYDEELQNVLDQYQQ